jgi:hypothetical protein
MVQCHKSVIVLGSEPEETNQNGSNHLLRMHYPYFDAHLSCVEFRSGLTCRIIPREAKSKRSKSGNASWLLLFKGAPMNQNLENEEFARLILALEPWLTQIVIIGGWAYRLYRLHPIAQRVDYLPLSTLDTDVAVPTRLKVTDTNIRERLITNGFEEERLPVFTKATVIQLFVMMGMAPIFTEGFA